MRTFTKGERMTESIDLLLELLDVHKPHLKPYSGRLKSWLELLGEYNSVAGTHYKQSRTLKKRFERVVQAYKADRSRIVCRNPQLLDRLVEEYCKPYRPAGKGNSDQEDEEDVYGGDGTGAQPHVDGVFQSEQSVVGLSPADDESSREASETVQCDGTKSNGTTVVSGKVVGKTARGWSGNGTGNLPNSNTNSTRQTAGNPARAVSAFDMEDLLRGDEQSKESSSQPPPLDTITLGMPRSFSVSNEGEPESADAPAILATSHYPPTETSKHSPSTPALFADLPKTFFVIDRNNRLVEVTSTVTASATEHPRRQSHPTAASTVAKTHSPSTHYGKTTASSPRTDLARSPQEGISPGSQRVPNDALPTPRELRLLAELRDIRREQRLYQSTVMSKLDAILQYLDARETDAPEPASGTQVAATGKKHSFRISKVASKPK